MGRKPFELGAGRSRWSARHLVAIGGLACFLFAACDDDGSTEPGDLNQQCATAADCKISGDCCTGCLALNVSQELEPCDSQCIQAPCEAEFGDAELSVTCNQGTCEIVAEQVIETSCDVPADCMVVSDCCLGCVALPVETVIPSCEEQCIQDPCVAVHGSDAVVSATCESDACELVIAQP